MTVSSMKRCIVHHMKNWVLSFEMNAWKESTRDNSKKREIFKRRVVIMGVPGNTQSVSLCSLCIDIHLYVVHSMASLYEIQ
jgi:hypothetical protein